MIVGDFLKIIMVVAGIVLFVTTIFSLAQRKLILTRRRMSQGSVTPNEDRQARLSGAVRE